MWDHSNSLEYFAQTNLIEWTVPFVPQFCNPYYILICQNYLFLISLSSEYCKDSQLTWLDPMGFSFKIPPLFRFAVRSSSVYHFQLVFSTASFSLRSHVDLFRYLDCIWANWKHFVSLLSSKCSDFLEFYSSVCLLLSWCLLMFPFLILYCQPSKFLCYSSSGSEKLVVFYWSFFSLGLHTDCLFIKLSLFCSAIDLVDEVLINCL